MDRGREEEGREGPDQSYYGLGFKWRPCMMTSDLTVSMWIQ